MDILSLSLKASPETARPYEAQKSLEGGFSDGVATAKGLAPPGLGPPPNPPLAKSGEEGATPELTAPSQIPDFSPDLLKEIMPGDSTHVVDSGFTAFKPKPFSVDASNRPHDPSADSLQAFGCWGVISIPIEPKPVLFDASLEAVTKKPAAPFETVRQDGERPKVKPEFLGPINDLAKLKKFGNWFKPNPALADVAGQRPHPATGSRPPGIPVDFPFQPSPLEPLGVPFAGERPKKAPSSDDVPMVFNGARPVKNPVGQGPLIDVDIPADDIAGSRPRPVVIDLGDDLEFPQPLELPIGDSTKNITDPFVPEPPEKFNASLTGEKPKERAKADAASADVVPIKAPSKNDASDGVENALTMNRPSQPVPKANVKPTLEKEEVKTEKSESKPIAEMAVKPKPYIAVDKTPDLTPKQADAVVRQVLDRVEELAVSRSARKVTVHLDPKEFGSITLVVGRRGGEVDAEIYASNDRVRQALEINRPALAAGLDQRGIQLSSMTVGSELPHGSGRHEQALQDAARHHQHNMSRFERSEATTHSLDAMRGLARKATGVDLWI